MMDDAPAHGGITRRQAVAGAAALGLTGALAGAHAQTAAPTARGSVFEDTDGSFCRGPGSKGMPDVLVSNGRDVVGQRRVSGLISATRYRITTVLLGPASALIYSQRITLILHWTPAAVALVRLSRDPSSR